MRKITDKEFRNRINQSVGNDYQVLSPYRGSKIKVKFKHNKCGHIFLMTPNAFLKGERCPSCGKKRRVESHCLTNKQFLRKLKQKFKNRYSPLETYKKSSIKIKVKCNQCGLTWKVTPNNLLQGYGCPRCGGKVVTSQDIQNRLTQKFKGQFKLLEPYQGTDKRILIQCQRCGYQWRVSPHSLLNSKGCPMCQTNHVYTTQEYKVKLEKRFGDSYSLVCDYHPHVKLRFKHQKCGRTFVANPADMLTGNTGCPHCKQSHGEVLIEQILLKCSTDFIEQKRFTGCRFKEALPFDFYLSKQRIAIEYDGKQHFDKHSFRRTKQEFLIAQLRDHIKDYYCQSHGIYLIRIPYTAKTPEQIKSYLYMLS